MFEKLESDGWQFMCYRDNCPVFRKVENMRGHWCAIVGDDVLTITYDQALGFEPITEAGKLSRYLGAMLLPNSTRRV